MSWQLQVGEIQAVCKLWGRMELSAGTHCFVQPLHAVRWWVIHHYENSAFSHGLEGLLAPVLSINLWSECGN